MRMRSLDRKLFRDLVHLRGQAIAVALVVACGLAMLITMWTAYRSLEESQRSYYREFRFADVFAQAKRAPESLRTKIAAIPGVAEVRTRVVVDVTLDVPDLTEPATGRLISIPERRTPILNDLFLRRGRWIDAGHPDEAIVSESFATGNDLNLGDSIGAIINGRWRSLQIVGIGMSPEYVYEIRPSDLFPDKKRFGVLWMSREALGYAYDMHGAFNDVSMSLAPGVTQAAVIAHLDRLLRPYGGTGAYGRDEQVSNQYLTNEIKGDRVTGIVLPAIFLGVAAFLIHIVLTRLVQTQRDQIAILKAFGYSNGRIGMHFLEFALVIVAAGSLLGLPTGTWLAHGLARMYTDFFQLPVLRFEVNPILVLGGMGVSALAASVGALWAVRGAISLPPAEAMRPEPPPRFEPGIIERLGLFRFLSAPGRIIVRNLARRKMKAFFSILGIALATAILVVGGYMFDAMDFIMDLQFHQIQREDLSVALYEPHQESTKFALAHLPGVMKVEPFRTVPVRLRHEHFSRRVGIFAMEPGSDLRRLVEAGGQTVQIPSQGIVLNDELARLLHAGPGDLVTVEVLEGARPVVEVPVAEVVQELIGISAYMDRRAVARMLDEPMTMTGALLQVDALHRQQLYERLKRMPAIAGVTLREAMLQSFEQTIAESLYISTFMIIFFACIIAAGMVYNSARIALSERGRELASLRVLGFTRREVAGMLLGEQAILTLAAIPFGFVLGYGLSAVIARAIASELYRLPVIITAKTYGFGFGVIVLSAVLSGLLIYRRIRTLDLVEVLKTRE